MINDRVEVSNLHRQTLYRFDEVGQNKAVLARDHLSSLNPFVTLEANTSRVDPVNIDSMVETHDLVLDCTDNFKTKFLINDACVLQQKPMVTASIYQHEGQILVYRPDRDGCLRCLWPRIPEEGCTGNCADVGVLGATVGFFGSLQAMEAIKVLTTGGAEALSPMVVGRPYELVGHADRTHSPRRLPHLWHSPNHRNYRTSKLLRL